MQTARRHPQEQHSSRKRMMAAINIQWQQLRPDLRHSPDELRDERLAFVSNVLKLKGGLSSMRELSDRQLGKVLDALKGLMSEPRLPNCVVPQQPIASATIIHLATAEQVHTINKLLLHLGWGEETRKAFIGKRFKRSNPVHLLPRQAHSLIRILLNIACDQELKERGIRKVTREMIALQIPALKARLGIDRPGTNSETTSTQTELLQDERGA